MVSIEAQTSSQTPAHCNAVYANREIIVREPATMTHARSGHPVTLQCATRVLLAPSSAATDDITTDSDGNVTDNDVAYECVKCGLIFEKPQGVVAHYAKHNESANSRYPRSTLCTIVRLIKYATCHGMDNAARRVAVHLNATNVPTLNGVPWNAHQVQMLYDRWNSVIRVRITQKTQLIGDDTTDKLVTTGTPSTNNSVRKQSSHSSGTDNNTTSADDSNISDAVVSSLPSTITVAHDMVRLFRDIQRVLETVNAQLRTVEPAIQALDSTLRATTQHDPSVVDKAQRWDQMQQLLSK